MGAEGPVSASTRTSYELTEALDRPVAVVRLGEPKDHRGASSTTWGPSRSSRFEFGIVDATGRTATAIAPAEFPRLVTGGVQSGLNVNPKTGKMVFAHHTAQAPAEVYIAGADGSGLTQLTHHNAPLLSQLDLPKLEGFSFPGADGDEVHGWLLRPPGFDPSKKYPVVFLIHGGPQGAWHDEWHNRWNYQMFAAPGYAVVAINPRGSTGYGQKFTDQISQDWTGRVYEDLMKGLDHALKTYPFLDESRGWRPAAARTAASWSTGSPGTPTASRP